MVYEPAAGSVQSAGAPVQFNPPASTLSSHLTVGIDIPVPAAIAVVDRPVHESTGTGFTFNVPQDVSWLLPPQVAVTFTIYSPTAGLVQEVGAPVQVTAFPVSVFPPHLTVGCVADAPSKIGAVGNFGEHSN